MAHAEVAGHGEIETRRYSRGSDSDKKTDSDRSRAQVEGSVRRYHRGVRWEEEAIDVRSSRWAAMSLPVWLYSYHQPGPNGGMLHSIAVNGRTGKTMDSILIQHWKLLLAAPATGSDRQVDTITGSRETRIRGDNVGDYRQRMCRMRISSDGAAGMTDSPRARPVRGGNAPDALNPASATRGGPFPPPSATPRHTACGSERPRRQPSPARAHTL